MALCVVTRIETPGIEVFDPKGTGPCTVYLCVSCRRVLWRDLIFWVENFATGYFYAYNHIQGGSNMTGTDLYVNKPHCAAAVRP